MLSEECVSDLLCVTGARRFYGVENEKGVGDVFVSAIDVPTACSDAFESFGDVV